MNRARAAALNVACQSNLKQVYNMTVFYLADNKQWLPPGRPPLSQWAMLRGFTDEEYVGGNNPAGLKEWCACPMRPVKDEFPAIFGMNTYSFSDSVKLSQVLHPSRIIFMADAYNAAETNRPNDAGFLLRPVNLADIIFGSPPAFRHLQSKANVLFVDGHLESLGESQIERDYSGIQWRYWID
jgi:prepilin-type processing-associated H-X9-DG protein